MAAFSQHEKLVRLHAVILKEREHAKALAIEEMVAAAAEKEELLLALDRAEAISPKDRPLAEKIRAENRRNAYLFWAALSWVRESMAFFGKQAAPAAYSAEGRFIKARRGGGILSGKI